MLLRHPRVTTILNYGGMRGGAAVSQDGARTNAVQARSPANTNGLDYILVVQQG